MAIQIEGIGHIENTPGFAVRIDAKYRSGLLGLDGFGHIVVLWHANRGSWNDELIRIRAPYKGGPSEIGLFATRSPIRPSGICMSTAAITGVDFDAGRVSLAWIDAEEGSPVLDIKPYHPSSDRIDRPVVPGWCSSWPRSLEQSARFDWSSVMSFG